MLIHIVLEISQIFSALTLDKPKSFKSYRDAINILKQDAGLTQASLDELGNSFAKLNNRQAINVLTNQATSESLKKLDADTFKLLLGIEKLKNAEAEKALEALNEISALEAKNDATREDISLTKRLRGEVEQTLNKANPKGTAPEPASLGATIGTGIMAAQYLRILMFSRRGQRRIARLYGFKSDSRTYG